MQTYFSFDLKDVRNKCEAPACAYRGTVSGKLQRATQEGKFIYILRLSSL